MTHGETKRAMKVYDELLPAGLLRATCLGCGLSRCGVRTCNAFSEPYGTCQTVPIKVDLKPPPECTKGKREIIAQPMSLNLHAVGLHFVESIKGIEEIPAVDPALSEEEEQPLTDIRFRASVRGWTNEAHRLRAQTLLDKADTRMATMLHRDKDIILIPRDWWQDKAGSLEPEDLGWWYTVNEPIKFRECRLCTNRRGNDLDEETRVMHSKECKGCAEILQEPTKKGSKRAVGKGKQPTTKRIQSGSE